MTAYHQAGKSFPPKLEDFVRSPGATRRLDAQVDNRTPGFVLDG